MCFLPSTFHSSSFPVSFHFHFISSPLFHITQLHSSISISLLSPLLPHRLKKRPLSGSCSPQQQWFMWSSLFSFFLCTLEGEVPICASSSLYFTAHTSNPQLRAMGSLSGVPWVQSRCCWYLICCRGVNCQLLTFPEPVLFVAFPKVSSTLTRSKNSAHRLLGACHPFKPLQEENLALLIWSGFFWT